MLIFLLSALSATSGFKRLSLSPGEPATLSLTNRTVVILDAPADSFNFTLTTADHRTIRHALPFPSRHAMLRGESVVLGAIAGRVEIPMWLLPSGACGPASAVLSCGRSLQLSSQSVNRYDPICLFTQAKFDRAEVAVALKTRDARAGMQFFGAGGADTARVACERAEKCRMADERPFFLRIQGSVNVTLSVKLDYDVDNGSLGGVDCSVLSVPWVKSVLPDGRAVYGQTTPVFRGMKFACRSQAVDILGILGLTGLALLGVFIVVGCFHGWRIVDVGDWLFASGEKRRFETLREGPFASELSDAAGEGGDP
jgi:hypothetical protein